MRKRVVILFICLLLARRVPAQESIRFKSRRALEQGTLRKAPAARRLPPHFMLEFRSYPGPEIRQELARRRMRVLQYLPETGLMVSSDGAPDLEGLDVTWAGALEPEDKVSPLLQAQPAGAYLVVFYFDADMKKARELAGSQGLQVMENPALLPWQLMVTGAYQDVIGLGANDAVAYILPASPDLMAGVPVIGCAGAITEAGAIGEYVEVGRGWAKDPGGSVGLNYFFQSLTEKMDENTARGEIERAFREWARHGNFTLSPGQQAGAVRSIDIKFARGAHGDDYPFNGTGVLAHTFYPAPPNAEPVAGDMHFNADEDWHAGANIDLFTVALHEAGHALGLGHSDRPGAVMYPYYHLATGLTDDDIAGITGLYGGSSNPPVQPPVTPPAQPPTQPSAQPPVTPPVQPPVPPPVQPPVTPPAQPPVQPPTTRPDTTPPSLSITSPGSTVVSTSSASITISGTASDNAGVAAVKWNNSFGDAGAASGTANWSAHVPLLVGNNIITIRAYDAAGNSGWRAITVVRR